MLLNHIETQSPDDREEDVDLETTISVTFDRTVRSVRPGECIVVSQAGGVPVVGAAAYDAPSRTLTFTPAMPLQPRTTYTVRISTAGVDLQSEFTAIMPHQYQFTTADEELTTLQARLVRASLSLSLFVAVAVRIEMEMASIERDEPDSLARLMVVCLGGVGLPHSQEIQTETTEIELRASEKTLDGLRAAVIAAFKLNAGVVAGLSASLGFDVKLDEDSDVAQLQDGDTVIVHLNLGAPAAQQPSE